MSDRMRTEQCALDYKSANILVYKLHTFEEEISVYSWTKSEIFLLSNSSNSDCLQLRVSCKQLS